MLVLGCWLLGYAAVERARRLQPAGSNVAQGSAQSEPKAIGLGTVGRAIGRSQRAADRGGRWAGSMAALRSGRAALGVAGAVRPPLWLAALLMGLPFDYGVKLPLLPNRAFSLIEVGVYGGVVVLVVYWAVNN